MPRGLQRGSNGETFEYLFFWGYRPPRDGSIGKPCFSPWYAAPFTIDSINFRLHWMMASKAKLFDDEESLAKILDAPEPNTYCRLSDEGVSGE
jgi:hypothetical protein